jgi:formamidopyrimidine-DNA glycosylase
MVGVLPDIMGLDERQDPEIISFWQKSRKFKDCPCCGLEVEYHTFSGLNDVFCPYCKGRVNI